MIIGVTFSKNGIKIRLTKERWDHIRVTHIELSLADFRSILKVVSQPDMILKGDRSELLAVKKIATRKWFVVPYKEDSADGFILTAYYTTAFDWLFKKEILWNKE